MLPDVDNQFRDFDIRCRYPVEHLLAGEYRSVFKGRGIEFEDVREYMPGDDVRTIDWKVTARTGVTHIKRYIEEREQIFYLIVDVSPSMKCGHKSYGEGEVSRWRTLVELSFLLALAAVKNNDRIGLILFSDKVQKIFSPRKGRQHVKLMMTALMREVIEERKQVRETNLSDALQCYAHLVQKRSIALVLSDFYSQDYKQDLKALAYRHDVIAASISNTNEMTVSASGLVRMFDSESGEVRVVDFGERGEIESRVSSEKRLQHLRSSMMECGVDFFECIAGADCVSVLSDFFKSRLRRMADETGG